MVEKVEIQTPETTSEQPSEDKTFENESRPEWLPGKFKSPEDMAKAYGELEGKLGKSETEKEETNKVLDEAEVVADEMVYYHRTHPCPLETLSLIHI